MSIARKFPKTLILAYYAQAVNKGMLTSVILEVPYYRVNKNLNDTMLTFYNERNYNATCI